MSDDPVVITGCGMVGPGGGGVDAFTALVTADAQVLEPIPPHWDELARIHARCWAPLPKLDWHQLGFPTATRMQTDRVTRLGLMATDEALRQAGLIPTSEPASYSVKQHVPLPVPAERCGVAIGCGMGGYQSLIDNDEIHRFTSLDDSLARVQEHVTDPAVGPELERISNALRHGRRFNPFTVAMTMPNATAARVAQRHHCEGPCRAPSLACASGTAAIGQAVDLIRSGHCDLVIAGGVEALVDHLGGSFRAFDAAGALARPDDSGTSWNRPFDTTSSGFLMAEGGAGIVVLERADTCRQRGGRPLAEVLGWAETTSLQTGIMTTEADGRAVERCHRQALGRAGITPQQIDYVNAHGTGTTANDAMEAALFRRLYRPETTVVSTKALIGHSFGASGGIEAVATVLALDQGLVHGHPSLTDIREDLCVPRTWSTQSVDRAITVSAAFGGHNACLVLQRPDVG